jgi:hypothetical protein
MTRLEKYDYLSTSYGRSAYTGATAHTAAPPARASSVGGGGVDSGMYKPTPGSTVSLSNLKYCGTELRVSAARVGSIGVALVASVSWSTVANRGRPIIVSPRELLRKKRKRGEKRRKLLAESVPLF